MKHLLPNDPHQLLFLPDRVPGLRPVPGNIFAHRRECLQRCVLDRQREAFQFLVANGDDLLPVLRLQLHGCHILTDDNEFADDGLSVLPVDMAFLSGNSLHCST